MYTLAIRTDKPLAELYLFEDQEQIVELKWEAHRRLAETLHVKISELLSNKAVELKDLEKIVVYAGPGSFTGLRIGVSVANALSYALRIPVIGQKGEGWLKNVHKLEQNGSWVVPFYGSEPHITQQKK
jgi:tRNA threonylcarbamoyladenosine biosynthesis protein TsaB